MISALLLAHMLEMEERLRYTAVMSMQRVALGLRASVEAARMMDMLIFQTSSFTAAEFMAIVMEGLASARVPMTQA